MFGGKKWRSVHRGIIYYVLGCCIMLYYVVLCCIMLYYFVLKMMDLLFKMMDFILQRMDFALNMMDLRRWGTVQFDTWGILMVVSHCTRMNLSAFDVLHATGLHTHTVRPQKQHRFGRAPLIIRRGCPPRRRSWGRAHTRRGTATASSDPLLISARATGSSDATCVCDTPRQKHTTRYSHPKPNQTHKAPRMSVGIGLSQKC